MPSQSKIITVKNTVADIWKVISDIQHPENWIPFLDSRKLTSDKQEPHIYFPSDMAYICQDRIAFNVLNVTPESRLIEISLSFGPLQIKVSVAVDETEDTTSLSVTAHSDVPASHVPEIDDILSGLATELAANIKRIASLKYPFSDNDIAITEPPLLLTERHPEMAIKDIKRISLKAGIEEFMAQTSPVIISDYGDELANYSSLRQFSWWQENFGSQTVPYITINDLAYEENAGEGMTTLSTVISMLELNPNNLRFATYEHAATNVLGLYQHLTPPSVIPKDCPLINAYIWIGSSHVKSPMHQDGRKTDCTGRAPDKMHNLNFQISGRKHVILAHPNQTQQLYAKPTSLHKSRFPEIEVDLFKPIDFNRFPLIKEAQLFETVLNPGELLYIPRGWWHAFYALENSINYNAFFSSHNF